jgi:hypothetical protein
LSTTSTSSTASSATGADAPNRIHRTELEWIASKSEALRIQVPQFEAGVCDEVSRTIKVLGVTPSFHSSREKANVPFFSVRKHTVLEAEILFAASRRTIGHERTQTAEAPKEARDSTGWYGVGRLPPLDWIGMRDGPSALAGSIKGFVECSLRAHEEFKQT